MILVPDRFVYLAAPRTGSRTTVEALLGHCGGQKLSAGHHATRAELAALDTALPVYSMMRDPWSHLMSAFRRSSHARLRDFVNSWNPDPLGEWDGRMAPYDGFVDHYFIYEDGLAHFFRTVGFPDVPLTHKGRYETPIMGKAVADDDAQWARDVYAEDFRRYDRWRHANACFII